MRKAPDSLHTLIASGDVYLRNSEPLQEIPEADVVCYGFRNRHCRNWRIFPRLISS